jgi:DNA-binding helix-hairpin-helix protein with protein kinase domain
VPLFTPPELQGQNFRGLVRSADHDAFGLAVLLFHLLYAGRHPYAGRYVDEEMPIEQAIAESRFAYGSNAAERKMSAPPGTLALEAFGAPIAAMFERAFSAPGAAKRPTAVEWVESLHALESELITCLACSDHDYPKGTACCWCELEDRASIVLFGRFALRGARFDRAEIELLWNDIKSVELPPDLSWATSQLAQALVIKTMGRRSWSWVWWLFYLVLVWISGEIVSGSAEDAWLALASFGGAILLAVTSVSARSARRQRETLLREANMRLSDTAFVSTLAHLENARQRLLEIHDSPWLVAPRIGSERRAQQREQRLRTLMLTDESAPVLSERERAALAAIGIESAADVLRERRQLHHWLSYAMVREIIQWAENFRAQVAVEAHEPLAPHELRAIDEDLRSEATRLLTDLRGGAASLQRARDVIVTARRAAAVEISSWAT